MSDTPHFDKMLAKLKESELPDSKKLVALFEANRGDVSAHYEGCIPAADGTDYWKWKPSICPLNEFHGPLFHKGFRQVDICLNGDTGEADSAIWKLLANGDTDFWDAHYESLKDAA